MDLASFVLEANCVDLTDNGNRLNEVRIADSTETQGDCQVYLEQNVNDQGSKNLELNGSKHLPIEDPYSFSEVKSSFKDDPKQVEESTPESDLKPEKGRASVVRLQAATNNTEVPLGAQVPNIGPAATSNENLPLELNCSWTINPSVGTLIGTSNAEEKQETKELKNECEPTSSAMQRFVTSDGQCVYAYKDAGGGCHFFYPSLDNRENHNEKERKRRSRVSNACGNLRNLVPGLNEKTDKATVFEQTARYLKFIRDKYGARFDLAYYEKHLQRN